MWMVGRWQGQSYGALCWVASGLGQRWRREWGHLERRFVKILHCFLTLWVPVLLTNPPAVLFFARISITRKCLIVCCLSVFSAFLGYFCVFSAVYMHFFLEVASCFWDLCQLSLVAPCFVVCFSVLSLFFSCISRFSWHFIAFSGAKWCISHCVLVLNALRFGAKCTAFCCILHT